MAKHATACLMIAALSLINVSGFMSAVLTPLSRKKGIFRSTYKFLSIKYRKSGYLYAIKHLIYNLYLS